MLLTLSDGIRSFLSLAHVTDGTGAPVTGNSTLMGSPARTRISLLASLLKSNFGASAKIELQTYPWNDRFNPATRFKCILQCGMIKGLRQFRRCYIRLQETIIFVFTASAQCCSLCNNYNKHG